ncbi:MAG: NADPH-dependent FMN reductase, partial [Candidatus Promineifilaceae bacterium]
MTILAFGASNSRNSINKALVTYAATLINNDVEIIDLNDFEMPIYSQDREQA